MRPEPSAEPQTGAPGHRTGAEGHRLTARVHSGS